MGTFYHPPQHTCPGQFPREHSRRCIARLGLHRSQPAGSQLFRPPDGSGESHRRRGRQELVRCMAHPRRVARVAKQIEREVGTLLLTDRVLQSAVCPEVRLGLDTSVSAIASVTEVELSRDMQVAKIYISVYSDPKGRKVAMRGLSHLEGYVRKHIASSMNMRLCPEIRFIQDDSIQRGEEVLALLERIRRQDAGEIEPPEIAISGALPRGDEVGDWDEDAAEEGEDESEEAEGFLQDLEEDAREEGAQRAEVLPEVAAAEMRRTDEGGEEEEEEEEDEDDSEKDDSEEEEDDEDDEVDGDSLRAWGINPDDPLALDFMPSTEGKFAPTVREPWRSPRELKRIKGRANKKGRKSTRRGR